METQQNKPNIVGGQTAEQTTGEGQSSLRSDEERLRELKALQAQIEAKAQELARMQLDFNEAQTRAALGGKGLLQKEPVAESAKDYADRIMKGAWKK